MKEVSVIIVNLNTRELLRDCLESVPHADDVEVLVIDNGSTDGSVDMVRTCFPGVRLVVNARNEGFAKPNNDGMNMAAGKYYFLLNSDTVLRPGALQTLVRFMDSHPEVAACGPKLVYPDGRIQRSVRGFPTLWRHCCDVLFLDRLFPRSRIFGGGEMAWFDYANTQDVDHVMAAALLVRRSAVTSVGGFDERFFIYYNDMDWCFRLRKAGWKVSYVHTAEVMHYHGQTVSEVNKGFAYFDELHNNTMLFYWKHYGPLSVVAYRLLLVPGFLARALGWTLYQLMRPTTHARHMMLFCWKTLGVGLSFWKPLPLTKP